MFNNQRTDFTIDLTICNFTFFRFSINTEHLTYNFLDITLLSYKPYWENDRRFRVFDLNYQEERGCKKIESEFMLTVLGWTPTKGMYKVKKRVKK